LIHVFWVEFSILYIIDSIKVSQIREKGLYFPLRFYKWDKIKGYEWISPNIIVFKVETFFNKEKKCKLIVRVKEDEKLKLNQILENLIRL